MTQREIGKEHVELSLNQATTRPYSLTATAEAAAKAGITSIGLWLEPVAELGIAQTCRLLNNTGLSVSSMCRAGFVADKDGAALRKSIDDVNRAIDLSRAVGSPYLTFIAGGPPAGDRDLGKAESRVRGALEELAPIARAAGVRLALEPLHPLFVGSRSVVTTIAQALRVINGLPADAVGVLVDAYANFWDPDLHASIAAAGRRIVGYQVSDFALPLPTPEHMNGRLFPGDGEIDLAAMTQSILDTNYAEPIEVEIFNDDIWQMPLESIIVRTISSFDTAISQPVRQLKAGV